MNRGGDGEENKAEKRLSVKLKGNDREGEKGTKIEEGRKWGKGTIRKKRRHRE